jgi:hypothetical protein
MDVLKELFQKNREVDFSITGQKVSVFSARKFHKEFMETAVRDSLSLAEELGLENSVVLVAGMYGLSYQRVTQIVRGEKGEGGNT